MKKPTLFNLLLGALLTGSPVVADDVHNLTIGKQTNAEPRRVSSLPLHASAMEAASTTTTNLHPTPDAVATNALPSLPPGVTELKFGDFFRRPIGPRGLEFSDELRRLEGRRIRILGYMVRQEQPVAHCFLLAPRPINLHEDEFGFCDDLPPAVLHVFTDSTMPAATSFTPGLLLLTGKLSLGNRTESDGRISTVRLQLDPPSEEQRRILEAAKTVLIPQEGRTPGHKPEPF